MGKHRFHSPSFPVGGALRVLLTAHEPVAMPCYSLKPVVPVRVLSSDCTFFGVGIDKCNVTHVAHSVTIQRSPHPLPDPQ